MTLPYHVLAFVLRALTSLVGAPLYYVSCRLSFCGIDLFDFLLSSLFYRTEHDTGSDGELKKGSEDHQVAVELGALHGL